MHWCTWALSFKGSAVFIPVPPVVPAAELTVGTLAEVAGVGLENVACNQHAGVRVSLCTFKYKDEMDKTQRRWGLVSKWQRRKLKLDVSPGGTH